MKKKRVTVYYGGFKFVYGGVNSHISEISRGLNDLGYQVVIVTLDSLPLLFKYLPHIVEKLLNLIIFPLGYYYKGRINRFLYKLLLDNKSDYNIFEDIYLSWNSKVNSITILHALWSDNLQAFKLTNAQLKKLKNKELKAIYNISFS